ISGNSSKGLKVVIVDDGNNLQQAQKTARSIAKAAKLLGVIGNYASEMTLDTVDIYEKNNLAQVSFGTTTKRLSTNHRRNFFRVVYTNKEEAETVVKYIQSINAEQVQVAGFYNPNSPFSNYFWIEIRDRLKQLDIPIYKAFDIAEESFNTQLALKEASDRGVNVYVLLPDGQVTNALSNAIKVIKADAGRSFLIGGNSIVRPEVTDLDIAPETSLAASTFWHPLSPQNPRFLQQSQQLWEADINNGTAMAYDAAIALIKAIKLQPKPSRQGTIAELANPEFLIEEGATGSIKFNSPKNGDRQDFYPTLVRLTRCKEKNRFIPLSLDEINAQELGCNIEDKI
ncbi:MAG: ABC transporter substrate-binding protein, partial [Cyanobacteria bacterium J06631_2]